MLILLLLFKYLTYVHVRYHKGISNYETINKKIIYLLNLLNYTFIFLNLRFQVKRVRCNSLKMVNTRGENIKVIIVLKSTFKTSHISDFISL